MSYIKKELINRQIDMKFINPKPATPVVLKSE